MEMAIAEGKYPVIDILTDVFALASVSGELLIKCAYTRWQTLTW